MLKNCFDALKPWLDRDMYFSMKDKEDTTRINSNYGKNKKNKDIDSKIEEKQNNENNDGDGILVE